MPTIHPQGAPGLRYTFDAKAGVVTRRLRRTLCLHARIPVAAGDRIRVRIRRTQGSSSVYVIPDLSTISIRLFPRL